MRSGWLIFSLAAVAVATGASCAQGYMLTGVGGSGGPGGGGGAGASGTTTTVVTTSSDTTSTTSTGTMCSQSPCKVTDPQCGCPSGKECGISNFAVACVKAGTKAWGASCTGATDCGPSTICVGGGTTGICDKFCDSDADCTSMGGFCAVQLSNGTTSGSIPGVTLCTNNCDPTTNTGCPTGMTCRIGQEQTGQMRWFGICQAAGTKGANATCTSGLDCLPRFDCFSLGGVLECAEYCDVNLNNCPGGGICGPLQDQNSQPISLNGKQIGACQ